MVKKAELTGKGENYEVRQISWFKTKKVTIKGEKTEIPIHWEKRLIGIYPTYDEALFILRRAQGNYRHECGLKGIKLIARFTIRKTGNKPTTRSVGNYLHSISGGQ